MGENKKAYKVTFDAEMTEEDIKVMNRCFYEAMEQTMLISPCYNLSIKLKDEQEQNGG